jgi:hypothetical protein
LYKVASVNVGMCIYDGSLVLRTGGGNGEVRVMLRDFRKKVSTGRIEMCELQENLVVKNVIQSL